MIAEGLKPGEVRRTMGYYRWRSLWTALHDAPFDLRDGADMATNRAAMARIHAVAHDVDRRLPIAITFPGDETRHVEEVLMIDGRPAFDVMVERDANVIDFPAQQPNPPRPFFLTSGSPLALD